jgi:hypothetical protein
MQNIFRLAAICAISSAIAFAQGKVTDQQPVNSATQPNGNSVNTSPNSTSPSSTRGQGSRTPSAPNQSLPGSTNPGNAAASDGQANGSAVRQTQPNSGSGATGTAAGSNPNGGDNSGNNGMPTDGTGNNPASERDAQTGTNPQTGGRVQWFWVALGLVLALFVIRMLMSRNRVRGNINETDPGLRSTTDRDAANRNIDADRNRDRIRRVS